MDAEQDQNYCLNDSQYTDNQNHYCPGTKKCCLKNNESGGGAVNESISCIDSKDCNEGLDCRYGLDNGGNVSKEKQCQSKRESA